MTFYKLSHQEWLKAATSLCPAEKDLYLYLKTLQPFPDGALQVSVDRIVADLQMHRDTVLRHLRRLREKGWLTYQIHSLVIKFTGQSDEQSEQSVERSNDLSERSNDRPERSNDLSGKNENPCTEQVSADQELTNNRGLKFLNRTLVKPQNDQSGIGQILAAIEAIGIRANTTIQQTVQKLYREFGPAAARRVELAIEAMQEQCAKGEIRNPGGFLNAALQRCFTPNEDGYRESKTGRSPKPAAETSTNSPPSPPPPPVPSSPPRQTAPSVVPPPSPPLPVPPEAPLPDADQLEQTCDKLLLQGDRQRVLERLQELIQEGYVMEVRSLLALRRDWRFKIRAGDRLVDVS